MRCASGTIRGSAREHAGDVRVDLADVGTEDGRQGHRSGVRAAAAERGDLPLHRDALEAGHDRAPVPAARAWRRRSPLTSRILARVWSVSVMMPTWLPVKEAASTPRSARAMTSSDMEIRSPVLTSMSYSRGGWVRADGVGQVDQVVGRLAHGADHGDDVGALAACPGDVVGHGTDPVGVADRGAAELLHDQWHPDEATDCAPAPWPPAAASRLAAEARRRPVGPGGRSGAPRGSGRVSGRAKRQESPPARGQGGAAGRRGQAAEAPQADPQRRSSSWWSPASSW